MKKVIISLAIIGVVAGITLGITGAWWTDQGVSSNQSFVSGNLNLRLSNSPTSGYGDSVTQTWNVSKMTPGGTPYVSTLYMKNNGSVNADYLKFTLANSPSIANMDKKMRITELKYKGENLLTGGAGADLSSYVAPTNCTVVVSKINPAILAATAGDVICVKPGTYTSAWEGGVVDVNKGVTIASTGGSGNTTISAGVKISADGVTIKGFTIKPATILGETVGVYLNDYDNAIIQYNEIDGAGISGNPRGIVTITNGNYSGVEIENNVIHDLTTGIYTNPHSGVIDIKYNEIYNTVAGIGGLTGANVQFNKFHNNSEAIGADNTYTSATLTNNEFLANDMVKNYSTSVTVNAEKNWWGDFNPSDQVTGSVDYSPYAGGPFIGYINGIDYNNNTFADLDDFEHSVVVVGNPGLKTNGANYRALKMGVQLDGPTTGSTFMGGTVGMDMTVTMGQGPAQ